MNYIDFKNNKYSNITILSLTGSGVTVNNDRTLAAIGDLVGNAFIFSTEKNSSMKPLYQTFTMAPTRSMAWSPKGDHVLIGTMEGDIMRWNYLNKDD